MTVLDTTARTGRIAGINPVAKLGVSALIAIPLILTLDPVSASVALVLECVLFFFAGIGWREVWLRTWPVWLAAPLTAVTIALYGETSGTIYVEWFVLRISDGSLALARDLPARARDRAAVGGAVHHGRPHRPRRRTRSGAEAARPVRAGRTRRVAHDRAVPRRLAGARTRAPGTWSRRSGTHPPVLRHGVRPARALDPQGREARHRHGGPRLRSPGRRTWARESRFGAAEWMLLAVGLTISGVAVAAAIATGAWNFILGPST